jgi:ATP-dependent metalloprotease FtsH
MSFVTKIFYILLCMYSTYTIIDSGIKIFYSPEIYYTTEYDLHHILSNSNFTDANNENNANISKSHNILNNVIIDRTTNQGIFIVNSTYHNIKNYTDHIHTKSKLIHYGLILPQGDISNVVNRLINNSEIRIEYYDKQITILEMFSLKTLTYYFILMIMLKIIFSVIVTQQISPIDNMIGDIDMALTSGVVSTKFTDVVGLVEAKHQIKKYVDIMKNRDMYTKIGASIPKGVLLCGPPGCGKTLLAKAVAGEAGVKFISVCGSDFDEIFIGVGSSRVKKLFDVARESAPCIVFIDEIDSIGEKRNAKLHRGSDTLNKILAEMDGFKSRDNIMVMASTNRESSLDSALLRSGRFDSKIYIEPPNSKERCDLYKLYLQKVKLDTSLSENNIDILCDKLSKMSPGATGADVANICNQSAINAVSDEKDAIRGEDIYKAIDDVMIGIEKKSKKVDTDELSVTAYHESGHALIGYLLKDTMSPMKVSIIPRGYGIAGYTQPQETEANNRTKEQMIAQIYVLLAGRCAELLKFKKTTTGAGNDFEKATKIAESMITHHGMYTEFSPMVFDLNRDSAYCISDIKRHQIEDFLHCELQTFHSKVYSMLEKYSDHLNKMAQKLLECEIMDYSQIKELFPDLEDSVIIS